MKNIRDINTAIQEHKEEVFILYDFYGCEINVSDYISALSEIKAILKE